MKIEDKQDVQFPDHAPECLLCIHLKITWEPSFPRACTLFGFKSRNQPSAEVFMSTGKHCFAFEAKKKEVNDDPNEKEGIWV